MSLRCGPAGGLVVANDPVNKIDPTGEFLDTIIDVAFIVADIADIAQNGFTAGNTASLAGNFAGALIPGATGLGVAAKAGVEGAQAAGKAADAAKTVKISASKSPEAAKHIKEAGVEGKKLTVDRAGAADRRAEALKGTETKAGMDRDEAPGAVFKEGGAGSSVRSIPSSDNRSAGAQLGNQIRDVPDGGCVKIEICD